jgi:hypothetical protein
VSAPTPQPNTIQLLEVAPQINPPAGIVLIYFDEASGLLKAVRSDGANAFPTGGAPGGNATDIQVNDGAGGLTGSGDFTYDASTGTLAFIPAAQGGSFEANPVDSGSAADFSVAAAPSSGFINALATDGTNNGQVNIDHTGVEIKTVGAADVTIDPARNIKMSGTGLGFFGTPAIAKPTVSGSKGGNAALTSLITALANYGLITDSTT